MLANCPGVIMSKITTDASVILNTNDNSQKEEEGHGSFKTDARGQEVGFGIKAKDRQRHMYVVGKTGMGKSHLAQKHGTQDIQNGEGWLIDPHGSAAGNPA